MSSEKRPKEGSRAAGDEDTGSTELEERDLFSTWELPAWDSLRPDASADTARRNPPSLPPSLPVLNSPELPHEPAAPAEAGFAPITAGNDVSSLAPTVRQPAAREPERRGSLRPLLAGLAAFACAAALWVGMPHPETNRVSAPRAAMAGAVDPASAMPAVDAPLVRANANDNVGNANSASSAAVVANVEPAPAHVAAPPSREIIVPSVTIDRASASPPRAHAARRSKAAISSSGPLPDVPRRADVIGTLNQLRSQLTSCSAGRSGVAEIDLTIAGSGAVANAVIGGDFAGTPQGSCLARAIRAAHFEPFAQARSRILYRMAL